MTSGVINETELKLREIFKQISRDQGYEEHKNYEFLADSKDSRTKARLKGLGENTLAVTFPNYSELLMFMSYSPSEDAQQTLAQNGINLAQKLFMYYDIVLVTITGEITDDLSVNIALMRKDGSFVVNSSINKDFESDNLQRLQIYDELFRYSEIRQDKEIGLYNIKKDINWCLYEAGDLTTDQRMTVLSVGLLSMKDKEFRSKALKELNSEKLLNEAIDEALKQLVAYHVDESQTQWAKEQFEGLKSIEQLFWSRSKVQTSQYYKKHSYTHSLLAPYVKSNTPIKYCLQRVAKADKLYEILEKDCTSLDILGTCYKEFIYLAHDQREYRERQEGQEGFALTPRHICDLFAELTQVNENTKLLDVCCGTGGILLGGLNKTGGAKGKAPVAVEFEKDRHLYTCINLILRGIDCSKIYNGDFFSEEITSKLKDEACDIGFMNPPYSLEIDELQFTEHFLDCLAAGAKGAIIIPSSIMGSIDDNELVESKRRILEQHRLEGVMNMNRHLFEPVKTYTQIGIFTAHESNGDHQSWFAHFGRDGFRVKELNQGREDVDYTWHYTKRFWVKSFLNRSEIQNFSKLALTRPDVGWSFSTYDKDGTHGLSGNAFQETIKEYLQYFPNEDRLKGENRIEKTVGINDAKGWAEYEVGKLFTCVRGFDRVKKSELSKIPGETLVVSCGRENMGIWGRIDVTGTGWNVYGPNVITFGVNGGFAGYCAYRGETFVGNKDVGVLTPRKADANIYQLMFITVMLKPLESHYNYGYKANPERFIKEKVKLPCLEDGTPDYQFMEDFIRSQL